MLKLVCDKYVLGLSWTLELSPKPAIRGGEAPGGGGGKPSEGGSKEGVAFLPCLAFLDSLLCLIENQLEASSPMTNACCPTLGTPKLKSQDRPTRASVPLIPPLDPPEPQCHRSPLSTPA